MGMFDYFTNRAQLMQPTAEPTSVEKELLRRRRLMSPTFLNQGPALDRDTAFVNPGVSVGAGADPNPASTVRPRLAAPPPPIAPGGTVAPTADPREAELQRARLKTAGYRDVTGPAVYDPVTGDQVAGKPVNNDRGVGGRLLDIFRQGVISAGEAYNNSSGDPGQRLMAAIGGGIAGGVGGGFRPTLDEERQRLYDIQRSTADEQRIMANQDFDVNRGVKEAGAFKAIGEVQNDAARIAEMGRGNTLDAIKAEQKLIFDTWEKTPDADPNNPEHAALFTRARARGMVLPKREKGKEYYGSWSPDGRFAVMEKNSGATELAFGGQAFTKPTLADDSDFKDDRFPWLISDAEAQRQALASIEPEVSATVIDPQTEADLVGYTNYEGAQPYRNADGSFNKNKFLMDAALGMAPVQYGALYKTQAKSMANKVAAKQQSILNSQKDSRAELAKFRLALKGKPLEAANEAADYFNRAMALSGGKRRAALKALYESLN